MHGEKENNMYKGINKKLLITTSSAEHRITRPHTLNMSLIEPEFSIDILQKIHFFKHMLRSWSANFLLNLKNFSLCKGLVKRSLTCSSILTWFKLIGPSMNFSRTKWYLHGKQYFLLTKLGSYKHFK